MSSDDEVPWDDVKEVLADALDLEPGERTAFLDSACEGRPGLRAAVEELLPEDEASNDFLAKPATQLFDAPAPEVGERIGSYELRGVLGEGGMGRVYEAVQERPHRTVALKVLRPGFLAGGAEQRFEWEAEALGRLSHPAIASVLEAGVQARPDGGRVSWFAMEKVDGRPLLEAADALGLDREARLRLFLRIAAGVSHAHQRGVIHRDIKPENVLVDDAGDPHIVDFGIARAADPLASSVTLAGEIVGTLSYMSPEQVLGDPEKVDVRTDVYSLGVLLYRMLTGEAPLDFQGLALPAVAHKLHTEDPTPAGRHDRTLRGDLETILATALERDVERRYASVDGFAGDVLAVLEERPVAARAPTAAYHLAMFARRHRGLVATAALALLSLIAAVVGTTIGLRRAEAAAERETIAKNEAVEARDEAQIERDRAEATASFLRSIFSSADPHNDGADVRVVDLLRRAGLELAEDESMDSAVRGTLHLSLGDTYRRLDVHDEALLHLSRAMKLLTEVQGPSSDDVLEARAARAEILGSLLRFDEAEAEASELRDAVDELRRTVAESERPAWIWMRPLEVDQFILELRGDRERALEIAYEVLEGWLELGEPGQEAVEAARNSLAQALLEFDRYEEAIGHLRTGLEESRRALGETHATTLLVRSNLAVALSSIGESQKAEAELRALVPLVQEAWGERSRIAMTVENNLASELVHQNRFAEALEMQRSVLRAHEQLFGRDHPETFVARNNLAVSLGQLGRSDEALEELDEILAGMGRIEGFADDLMRANVQGTRATVLGNLGRNDEAIPALRDVLGVYTELVGEAHGQVLIVRNNLAMTLMEAGEVDEAAELAAQNLELAETHQPGHPHNTFPFRMNLGRALVAAGRKEEGLVELEAVEEALTADPDASDVQRERIREVLEGAQGP